MKFSRSRGSTGNILVVFLADSTSTSGAGKTGLTSASAGLSISVRRELSSSATTSTGANIGAVGTLGTWVDPGAGKANIKEVDATAQPGLYEIHLPDAVFGTSDTSRFVTGMVLATGVAPCPFEIELTAWSNQDAVRGGMTAFPNVASGSAGALLVDGTGTAAISNSSGKVLLQATQSGVTIPTVTTVTNQLTAAAIATGVWQDATGSDFTVSSSIGKSLYTTGNAPGAASGLALVGSNMGTVSSVTGSVGSVTGAVGSVTGAVGSVTGNVGGNVTGSVGSVVGAVGSVSGSVGSIATGGISSASYAADTGQASIRSGTAQAGAAGSITLDAGASSTTDFYKGAWIVLTGGTGQGQVRLCTAYNGTSKIATVAPNWATTPDATTTFAVRPAGAVDLEMWGGAVPNGLQSGRVDAYLGAAAAGVITSTVAPNLDATVSSRMATFTLPANFSALGISAGGAINEVTLADTVTTTTTATNLTNLPSITAGWLTAAGIAAGALNGKGDWLTSGSYTAPPTVTQIATAVWQDTTAGDFTVAGSIGKSLFTSGNAPGAASGLSLVGSAMGAVASVTGNVGGNVAGSVGSVTGAVGSVTGNVGGNVVGSVNSVTTGVTVTTNNDKTGYSLTQAFPANFAALGISVAGKINEVVLTDTTTTLTNLPSMPASWLTASGIASGALVAAVWDGAILGHTTAGTFGGALNAAGSAGDPWTTDLPGAYPAGTAGYILGTNLNATVSSRLAATSYVVPPSAASIATTVWQDLTAGSDFGTAGSVGALLKTDLDATISSRLQGSSYTAPPSAAAIATAVWTDGTAGDFATVGTPGKILVSQLGGTFTTTTSSVFTVAALANGPGGGGGSPVTVSGYAAGQDPATLVLGAAAASWNGAGTIGQKINAAGAAGDPLTSPVPNGYAAGTAGAALGRIASALITVVNPLSADGTRLTLIHGDSYQADDGRALSWTDTGGAWPTLTGATVAFEILESAVWLRLGTATATVPSGSNKQVQVELSNQDGAALPLGNHQYRIVATLADGHIATLVEGHALVNY